MSRTSEETIKKSKEGVISETDNRLPFKPIDEINKSKGSFLDGLKDQSEHAYNIVRELCAEPGHSEGFKMELEYLKLEHPVEKSRRMCEYIDGAIKRLNESERGIWKESYSDTYESFALKCGHTAEKSRMAVNSELKVGTPGTADKLKQSLVAASPASGHHSAPSSKAAAGKAEGHTR